MRAVVFDGASVSLSAHHPAPVPAAGEAVIRPLRAAVSRTDREIVRGLLDFRGVLGHEFVGVAEYVEGDDPRSLTGRRVVGSVGAVCGRCDLCLGGLSAHCRERTMLGLRGRDGCFADRFTLPLANLVAVPDDMDDDRAVFAESLAAAIQAARQLTIEGKPYITVLGDGPLGLLVVQVMAKLNASVRLVGRYSEKLAVCEKWGIKHRHVDDVGRRADQDVVVDCTGSGSGLELAMQLVRPRGTIVLKTLLGPAGRPPRPTDLSRLALHEIRLLGSHRGPLAEAMTMIARGEVDVVGLITGRTGLEELPKLLSDGRVLGGIKTLVGF